MITPRTPSGVLELLPPDQVAFQRMLDAIRAGYERFGFLPIETPVFERSDVLLTKTGGETERQVYFVQSTGALEKAQEKARAEASADRTGKWRRGVGYTGYAKSLYDQDWFDSGTEKAVAVILDDADEIDLWCRLQTGDLRIVWESDGRQYAPDFVAVETEGTHWVIEPKARTR